MRSPIEDIVRVVETWPEAAQAELLEMVRDMDAAFRGGGYHASAEELAGIDRGLADARAGSFATDDEMSALFAKYRRG